MTKKQIPTLTTTLDKLGNTVPFIKHETMCPNCPIPLMDMAEKDRLKFGNQSEYFKTMKLSDIDWKNKPTFLTN